jgi:hypothetical protein
LNVHIVGALSDSTVNYRGDTSGSNYFQTAQAKLIYCFRTHFGFIFGVDSDLSRQSAEL